MFDHLFQRSNDVLRVVRSPQKFEDKDCINTIYFDYKKPDEYLQLPEGCHVAVNFVGPPSRVFQIDPLQTFTDLEISLLKIIQGINRSNIKRVINISTIHVYSPVLEKEYNESSALTNTHPYAIAHKNKELLFSDYLNKDIQLTNLRLGNVFGVPSAHKGDFSNLLVNQLVKSIACGVTFEVKSDRNTMRNFISRDDFCDLLLKLVSGKALLESGPLNMGGKDISITNMVELVSDIFNKHL
jgi:nucleoside-diphosphate-sugar epimerase